MELYFVECLFHETQRILLLFLLKSDIDECAVSNDACTCASQRENPSCNATCINIDGNYKCECSDGYKLYKKKICIGKLCMILSLKSLL